MNILITGGSGFLGQHLMEAISKEIPTADITVLDRALGDDLLDYEQAKEKFKGQDVVIHAAGIVTFSFYDKERLHKINVEGTRNALNAAEENNVRQFVHISSVAALGYKDDPSSLVDEEFKFDWRIAERKKKYYMISKRKADELVDLAKIQTTTVYPGLMYGPGDKKTTTSVINAIKNGRVPALTPGGTNIIDVRDVARGIALIIKKGITGKYILSGENLTFKEVYQITAEEVKGKTPKITIPKWTRPIFCKTWRILEMFNRRIDLTTDLVDSSFSFRYFTNAKASREIGWTPEYTFRQTIKDSIRWMENGTQE